MSSSRSRAWITASLRASSGALVAQPLGLGLQAGQLVADEVQADRPQLGDEPVVAAGRVGLLLQRRQAPADLPQQVVQPQEVALGGLEPALGPLPALAVLQDSGRFLDHAPGGPRAGRSGPRRAGPGPR